MKSVFRKLIRKEFGEKNYLVYFSYVQQGLHNKTLENREVYEDIYRKLIVKDAQAISKMHDRLNDSMLLAFRISKTYTFTLIVYLAALLFLFIQGIAPFVFLGAFGIMSICFAVKTYEFIVNKYCYIDAQIVLVYKTALETILLLQKRKYESKINS